MMVTITSCAPVYTFSAPGIAPHSAPPAIPASSANGRWITIGKPSKWTPTATAEIVPMMNCPDAPILNRPALKATATDNPVRISGVILRMVVAHPRALPKAPENSPRYAESGSSPESNMMSGADDQSGHYRQSRYKKGLPDLAWRDATHGAPRERLVLELGSTENHATRGEQREQPGATVSHPNLRQNARRVICASHYEHTYCIAPVPTDRNRSKSNRPSDHR